MPQLQKQYCSLDVNTQSDPDDVYKGNYKEYMPAEHKCFYTINIHVLTAYNVAQILIMHCVEY